MKIDLSILVQDSFQEFIIDSPTGLHLDSPTMTSKPEATGESLMNSGTTDGDMPSWVYPESGNVQRSQGRILIGPRTMGST
jgi:hypothetical protein